MRTLRGVCEHCGRVGELIRVYGHGEHELSRYHRMHPSCSRHAINLGILMPCSPRHKKVDRIKILERDEPEPLLVRVPFDINEDIRV